MCRVEERALQAEPGVCEVLNASGGDAHGRVL